MTKNFDVVYYSPRSTRIEYVKTSTNEYDPKTPSVTVPGPTWDLCKYTE